MTREQIFELLKHHIGRVRPDIAPEQIAYEVSLKELGADSVDRADICTSLKDDLGIDIQLVELGKVPNIGALVDLLHRLVAGASAA